MNAILKRDLDEFVHSFELANELADSSFLITGATGLIGSTLVHSLLALDKKIKLTLPVRSLSKANDIFEEDIKYLNVIEGDLVDIISNISEKYDYIIHCASPTSGSFMIKYPVETFALTIESTKVLLEYSRKHPIRSMTYISSLEYYGEILSDQIVDEMQSGYIDPQSARSCYPLGKRAAEYLCVSYAKEYGVPVTIARLTQTLGAGISINDQRLFAQLARCAVQGNDIVLHSDGESSKPYCYTMDSICGILYILIKGISGEAYNVANPDTYISVKDLAYFIRDNFNKNINVRFELNPTMGYAPTTKLNLSVNKLMGLNWRPKYNLFQMFDRLIKSL